MRLIYLAGPYSHKSEKKKEERVKTFRHALAHFANTAENLCIYSPIVHWHEVAKLHKLPRSFDFWMQQDFHMIRKATALWVMDMEGWKESFGVAQEIEFAKDIGKEMFLVKRDDAGYFLSPMEII